MPMFPFCFRQLQQCLARFGILSRLWPAVLAYRIVQCEGFLEQLTLSEERTADWLCRQTAALLETLPEDVDDHAVIRLLAAEFEGFHCHAVDYAFPDPTPVILGTTPLSKTRLAEILLLRNIEKTQEKYWNSLQEPFSTFIGRHPEAELFIGVPTHVSQAEAAFWFASALGMRPCL